MNARIATWFVILCVSFLCVALTTCTCFAVLRAISAALRRPGEGEQAGYGLRDGPWRRRRLMGREGGY